MIPQSNQNADPYLDVSISVDRDTSLHQWTGAPVTVSVTKELAKNVLAAPITSLLAPLGGGYALEVLGPLETILVPVETGVYADGWVEILDSNLKVGTQIVTPVK